MKVLLLTWEFPPYISGGLGMACYGLAKALLESGISVDLMLPTSDDVYFPLRTPNDVNTMPVEFFEESKKQLKEKLAREGVTKKLKDLGLSAYPESYITRSFDFDKFISWLTSFNFGELMREADTLRKHLRGYENMFVKVQEFMAMVVKNARFLDFDVIHANDWLTFPAAMMLKKLTGKPFIAHIHATEFDRAGGAGDPRIHNIEYLGLATADRVISVSNYTANIVQEKYRINPAKLKVVHNAYHVSEGFEVKRTRLFKDPLVLFLGRVTLQKGPDYFLEIADRVLCRCPKVRFVMAGNGDMFSRILRGSAEKRLKDRFLFAGFLDRKEVEAVLSASDIFVLPSVSEPFGIAPLEAMAYGAVAIVSKQSGVAEVIKSAHKIDFWDVEKTADLILDLLEKPEEMERLAKAGQSEALSIEWREAALKAKGIYEELLCCT